jgi:hypothetical protein
VFVPAKEIGDNSAEVLWRRSIAVAEPLFGFQTPAAADFANNKGGGLITWSRPDAADEPLFSVVARELGEAQVPLMFAEPVRC